MKAVQSETAKYSGSLPKEEIPKNPFHYHQSTTSRPPQDAQGDTQNLSTVYPLPGYDKELAFLSKLIEPSLRYHGDNDTFDFKLKIFLDMRDKAGIPELFYAKAYSIILTGPALIHYYILTDEVHRGNFDILCPATKKTL